MPDTFASSSGAGAGAGGRSRLPRRSPGARWLRSLTVPATGAVIGLGLLHASAGAAPRPAPATSAITGHTGSLHAVGVCPYFPDDYSSVRTTGTLTGFTPKRTYYVYDNTGASTPHSNGAKVVTNAHGDIVLKNKDLPIAGPDQVNLAFVYGLTDAGTNRAHPSETDNLHYYISSEGGQTSTGGAPADLKYRVPTTLEANPSCNLWTLSGGATLANDPSEGMSDDPEPATRYSFGAGVAANGSTETGNGDYGLYDGHDLIWSTHTSGGSDNRLVMQTDGNLVVYNGSTAVWSSGTGGHPGSKLVLQLDRNLVIYGPTGKALWSSDTGVGA